MKLGSENTEPTGGLPEFPGVQPTLRSGGSSDPGRPSFQDALQGSTRHSPDPKSDVPSDDSASGLSDPDRDAWTQQIIGRRIHWQYGPDGKRHPFFRQRTDFPGDA